MCKYNFTKSTGDILENYEKVVSNDEKTSTSSLTPTKGKFALICAAAGAFTIGTHATTTNWPNIFINENQTNIEAYVNETKALNEYREILNTSIIKYKQDKKEIVRKILAFKMLNENWDGYGAFPLEAESAANAIELIDKIGEELFKRVSDVYPNPNGTITFEWNNIDNEILSVEVGNNDISYYMEYTSEEIIYRNNRPINDDEAETISQFIKYI